MRISRTTTVLAVTALAVTALLPVSGAGAVTAAGAAPPTVRQARSCSPSWKLETTPTAPGPSAAVVSVSALSSRDVRFSGEADLPRQPWALRWNGKSVAASAQIPQAPYAAQFGGGGSFDSASDGWVLAPFFPAGGVNTTAERWHDRRWTAVPLAVSPQPLTEGLAVGGLASQSARSAWAAGYFYKAAVGVSAGTAPTGALIEHWDGSQWSIVPNPAASRQGTSLHSLTVVSPTDIWAAGGQSDARGSTIPFFEHWNGTTWRIVPAPALPATVHPAALYTFSAASSSDIWAVGGKTVQFDRPGRPAGRALGRRQVERRAQPARCRQCHPVRRLRRLPHRRVGRRAIRPGLTRCLPALGRQHMDDDSGARTTGVQPGLPVRGDGRYRPGQRLGRRHNSEPPLRHRNPADSPPHLRLRQRRRADGACGQPGAILPFALAPGA